MTGSPVLITGLGLISSQGEGAEAHWQAVSAPQAPNLEREAFAPYTVHKLCPVDWNLQIPRRSDQRQMETWQRLGTYAAGLALEDAGLKGNEALTAKMDMVIAAGGGERDIDVDAQILAKGRLCKTEHERALMLNQMLMTELRPTLFLAQLSNLLAGNISIVHKVTGSSRTFMGEEGCGLAAVETAFARIRSGQSSHVLVGASYNAEHYDVLLGQELNSYLKTDGYAPVWSRKNSGGELITGSAGAFLVLESAEHAKARGARVYAELKSVQAEQTDRRSAPLAQTLAAMVAKASAEQGNAAFAVSGASGAAGATQAEEQALQASGLPYRAFSSLFGHVREAQFIFAAALAALSVAKARAFAPMEAKEQACEQAVEAALVTMAGIDRAEGVAALSKYSQN